MSGPLPAPLTPIAIPAAYVYAAAMRWRNARFDRGEGVERLDIPVISIGNLTVGGTGKTPMTAWTVRRLIELEHTPAIAMRGYRAHDGISDEADEHRRMLPGVPVIVGADRYAAIERAGREGASFDCVVLDDGFQHRRLHRDLDLVLIDRRRPGLDDRVLPAGWLREPPSALARADGVIVSHAEAPDAALAAAIERWHGRPPLAWFRHAWKGLTLHRPGDVDTVVQVNWLRGCRVLTSLGIGQPAGVEGAALDAGATIVARFPRGDHARYDRRDVEKLARACRDVDALLVTAKDWAKLGRLIHSGFPVPVVVPMLEFQPVAGAEALIEALRAACRCGAAIPRPRSSAATGAAEGTTAP